MPSFTSWTIRDNARRWCELEAERDRLREALEKIVDECDYAPSPSWSGPYPWQRIARAALEGGEDG